MTAGYSEDLAFIHDSGFGGTAREAARALRRLFGRRRGLVVDLGCGSGAASRELVAAGFEVHGIDISPSMIRLARRKVAEARFAVGSIRNAELPTCDAVIAAGEVINYAFDPRFSIRPLFRRLFAALRPGGVFLFDFLEPGGGAGKGWVAGEGWAVVSESVVRGAKLTRRITSFRETRRGLYRRTDEVHEVRLLRAPEVVRTLRAAGFTVRRGAYPVRPGAVAIAARKPVR